VIRDAGELLRKARRLIDDSSTARSATSQGCLLQSEVE